MLEYKGRTKWKDESDLECQWKKNITRGFEQEGTEVGVGGPFRGMG